MSGHITASAKPQCNAVAAAYWCLRLASNIGLFLLTLHRRHPLLFAGRHLHTNGQEWASELLVALNRRLSAVVTNGESPDANKQLPRCMAISHLYSRCVAALVAKSKVDLWLSTLCCCQPHCTLICCGRDSRDTVDGLTHVSSLAKEPQAVESLGTCVAQYPYAVC